MVFDLIKSNWKTFTEYNENISELKDHKLQMGDLNSFN